MRGYNGLLVGLAGVDRFYASGYAFTVMSCKDETD